MPAVIYPAHTPTAEPAPTVELPSGEVVALPPKMRWQPQDHLMELGGFILAAAIAKAIREQGVGEVTEKLQTLLSSPVFVQAVRSAGNALTSLVQVAATNRIAAFGGLSLTALSFEHLKLIPKGSSPWFIAALSVVTGAEMITEGLESMQGLMPFTTTTTTDTDFPSFVTFNVEGGGGIPGLRQLTAKAGLPTPED